MRRYWPTGQVIVLIETIKKEEQLWNAHHPEYTRSKRYRHKVWCEIIKLLNQSQKVKYQTHDVQVKWNNLRVQFRHYHKKYTEQGFNGKRWRYYNLLTFLTVDTKYPAGGKRYSLRDRKLNNNKDSTMDLETLVEDKSKTKETDEESYVSVGSVSPRLYQNAFDDDYPSSPEIMYGDTSENQSIDGDFDDCDEMNL